MIAASIAAPGIKWDAIAPVICLVAAALIIIMVKAVTRRDSRAYDTAIAIAMAGIVASGYFLWRNWDSIQDHGPYQTMSKMVAVDGFSVFLGAVVLVATLFTLLLSSEYLDRHGIASKPEYLALLLLSAAGMLVMTTANDLIVVFVALEALSIPLYVLAAYDRNRRRSLEAGMKYFILGAFSSAIFLYGIALVYGGDRHDVPLRDRGLPLAGVARRRGHADRGRDAPARRPRLQGRGGAVPHVDARRLRGCTHPGHRVHGLGDEGGRLRGAAPGPHDRVRLVPDGLAPGDLGARDPDPAARQHRGAGPDRHQADAGLLLDQPRRLRAHRPRGRARSRA